jgi:hypothetical protein
MKAWLEPYLDPADLAQYDETKIMGVITAVLLPLHAAGRLDDAVEEIWKRVSDKIPDQDASKDKIRRYMKCFCEAMV